MKPVTITMGERGITDVDFVQWILNEIGDKAYTRSMVADTYAILLQKGVGQDDLISIHRAIIQRWPKGLRWIKQEAWKRAGAA